MLVVGGLLACGALLWWNQDPQPARPAVRRLPSTATKSEKWENELTEKAQKIIRLHGDVRVQPGKSYRKREIHCSLINKEVSWDDLLRDFGAFCLKEGVSESSVADKQVSDWATSVTQEIESLKKLNASKEIWESAGRYITAGECIDALKEKLNTIADIITKQLELTKDSEVEGYKKYHALLQASSDKKRWLPLISFVYTGASMSEKGLQLFVNSPTVAGAPIGTTVITSDEEAIQKTLQEKTKSGRVALATAVIQATGQQTMVRTEYFGRSTHCFPTGFTSKIEAPTSTEGEDFRKAVERTTATLHAEAVARYKQRTSWLGSEGGATWSKASKEEPAVVFTKSNPLTREMDKFLDSVPSTSST